MVGLGALDSTILVRIQAPEQSIRLKNCTDAKKSGFFSIHYYFIKEIIVV
ncbi:MAG: hypothetical protein HY005_01565 [Candidatus Staskawiczbacteria bacterium]|nr:hypothetical protein [Candidatus Staskawiczbacteria bacterium]